MVAAVLVEEGGGVALDRGRARGIEERSAARRWMGDEGEARGQGTLVLGLGWSAWALAQIGRPMGRLGRSRWP